MNVLLSFFSTFVKVVLSFQVKLGFEALNGLNDAAVHVHDVAAAALDLTEEEVQVVPCGNPEKSWEFQTGKPTKPSLALPSLRRIYAKLYFLFFYYILIYLFNITVLMLAIPRFPSKVER